ncbi:MAG: UDP-N-acetylglucosamine 2-epimerase (hydrolyzing) [Gammaproteobacteria bacterium]|nr:UDP-N-acetylglucosamine 2-epimerase (hydrolyzing) [Gammaproteobacteria bacterium]
MTRKVCVVTGTRAEFGLLRWLMDEIRRHHNMELQVVATGMHLSSEFGLTYREIEDAGFSINERVDMLLSSDSSNAISKSIGLGLIGFADVFERLKPDLLVVLGDRYEIFSAVSSALIAGIPVSHIHGGELTEGAYDDAIRHSITKMSHLHFVATDEYRRRVIQLGEQPSRVFNVGGMAVDAIKRVEIMGRESLEESLGFKFGNRNLLVTFHPATLDHGMGTSEQMRELLDALHELDEINFIFTMPNADTGSRRLGEMVRDFTNSHSNSCLHVSLGQLRYFSCLSYVDGVVGNSSSGLLEAPSFNIGTINIGDRQMGRIKASSVIDCEPKRVAILQAIDSLYADEFQDMLKSVTNPYGDGGASKLITQTLAKYPLENICKKHFFDLLIKDFNEIGGVQ